MSEPRLLRRDFVLLWQGLLVSQLGDQALLVGQMLWVTQQTGSQALLGALLAAATLPAALLAPLAGVLADRHDRKALIVGSDLFRGLLIMLLAWLFLARPGATAVLVGALFVVAVLGGTVSALFQPALYAALPDVVPIPRLQAANSLTQLSGRAAAALGQAVGGVAYAALGAPALFLIDGLSFLFSGVSESLIRIPRRDPPDSDRHLGSRMGEVAAGLDHVRSRRGMSSFLLVTAGVNLLFAPTLGLLPFYVRRDLAAEPQWVGFLLAALSLGGISGSVAAAAVPRQGRSRSRVVSVLFAGAALSLTSLGFVGRPLLALWLFALLGALSGAINVTVITQMQSGTPPELRGRVMGLVIGAVGVATPVGLGVGGLLTEATGVAAGTVLASAGALATLLVLWGLRDRDVRAFLAAGTTSSSVSHGSP